MVLYQSTGNATLDVIATASGAATPALVIEWYILLGLVVLFTSLRTLARAQVSGLRGLSWDDYLVWVAVILYAALSVNVYIIGVMTEGLASDGISDERRAALAQDPEGQEARLRRFGAMAQVAKLLIYALVLWTLKASLLYCFAIRLTGDIPGAKGRTMASVGLLVITFLGSMAALLTSCRPFPAMWQLFPDAGIMCQANISPLIIAVFLACNILSDVYLVSMPIPVIIRAPLKSTQKLSLISLFSCNVLITGMAIVRAYFIIKDPWTNGDGMWEIRETFVAIITTCVPPIVPMVKRLFCCGSAREKLTTSERVEAAKRRASKATSSSRPPSRKGSTASSMASKRSRAADAETELNRTMSNRYLSGLTVVDVYGDDPEKLMSPGSDVSSRSSSAVFVANAGSRAAGQEADKEAGADLGYRFEGVVRQDPYAHPALGRQLTGPKVRRTRDEDAAPQTVRDIV